MNPPSQQKKRVLLNRRRSSLTLDLSDTKEYTHQLVANALKSQQEVAPKKIGSLKSSLRTSASAPCSPNKSVSFSHQEDVCLFRKAQTPLAISQKNIFWADDETSSSSSDSDDNNATNSRLEFPNWPEKDIINSRKLIKIDKNQIELDQDVIYGKVSVKNLHFHKSVTIRYTWDLWESFDNVQAQFYQGHKNYDVFEFKIPVHQHKHLYFAIHYSVGNQDYWDSNDGRNYAIEIHHQQSEKETTADSLPNLKSRYDFSKAAPASMPISASRSPISCNSPTSPVDLNSQSYTDLVNKYCFYSTSPSIY